MQAVSERAYPAGELLYEVVTRACTCESASACAPRDEWRRCAGEGEGEAEGEERAELLESMLFARGSHLDHNPLYMLLSNDTCSFTWTGANHIDQVCSSLTLTLTVSSRSHTCVYGALALHHSTICLVPSARLVRLDSYSTKYVVASRLCRECSSAARAASSTRSAAAPSARAFATWRADTSAA